MFQNERIIAKFCLFTQSHKKTQEDSYNKTKNFRFKPSLEALSPNYESHSGQEAP